MCRRNPLPDPILNPILNPNRHRQWEGKIWNWRKCLPLLSKEVLPTRWQIAYADLGRKDVAHEGDPGRHYGA